MSNGISFRWDRDQADHLVRTVLTVRVAFNLIFIHDIQEMLLVNDNDVML